MKIIAAKQETNGEGKPCLSFPNNAPTKYKAVRFDGANYTFYEEGDLLPPVLPPL